jgi:hypothetical protein
MGWKVNQITEKALTNAVKELERRFSQLQEGDITRPAMVKALGDEGKPFTEQELTTLDAFGLLLSMLMEFVLVFPLPELLDSQEVESVMAYREVQSAIGRFMVRQVLKGAEPLGTPDSIWPKDVSRN